MNQAAADKPKPAAPPAKPPPAQQPAPLHWAYLLLYMVGITAALWQHGQPQLTLVLLIAAGVVGILPYVPVPQLGDINRKLIQHMISAVGVMWMFIRLNHGTPADLLLIEGFTIIGINFGLGRSPKEFGYLLLIAATDIGYGAVIPPRAVYVWMLPIGIVLCLLLLYHGRAATLARLRQIRAIQTVSRRNAVVLGAHAVLVLIAWMLLFSVMPIRNRSPWQRGAVSSSFTRDKRNELPDDFQKWMTSSFQQTDPRGRRETTQGSHPTHASRQANQVVTGDDSSMAADGNGGGSPGKDLVMRVESPLKLYWLAALYDRYDGKTWRATRAMQRQTVNLQFDRRRRVPAVPQRYTIEKWISPALYSAFMRKPGTTIGSRGVPTIRTFYGERFLKGRRLPRLPFNYSVRSVVADAASNLSRWSERIPPEHYLHLPDLDERIHQKAAELTRDAATPLEQAMALRDYFRRNYTYSLETRRPPEDRETVEYFLFEMNAGHCEYFAAALAVMGRCIGLPSRVATGFAPGNYNVINGRFEVYEYHAHAWTQIYIEGIGWLTIDGTPAGAPQMESKTTPLGIGSLRDPFSDEWRVTTPELASETTRFAETEERFRTKARAGGGGAAVAQAMGKLLVATQRHKMRTGKPAADDPEEPAEPGALRRIRVNLENAFEDAVNRIKAFLTGLSTLDLVAAILFCVLVILLIVLYPVWRRRRRFQRQLQLCESRFAEAEAASADNAEVCITACYKMLRDLLTLAGMPRDPAEELVDYATGLDRQGLAYSKDVMAVFVTYFELQYHPVKPSLREAHSAFEHARQARAALRRQLAV